MLAAQRPGARIVVAMAPSAVAWFRTADAAPAPSVRSRRELVIQALALAAALAFGPPRWCLWLRSACSWLAASQTGAGSAFWRLVPYEVPGLQHLPDGPCGVL